MKKKTSNKNNKKLNIYLIINSILLGWLVLTTILILKKYDILPAKYFIPILCGMIIIPSILIFIMLKKKIKKKIKIGVSVISILLIIVLTALLFYLGKTFSFINSLSDKGYTTENYEVIVLNDSKYNEIKDIEGKTLGYYKNETSNIEQALEELKKQVTTTNVEYNSYEELVDKLYNKQTEAIIIEEAYRDIIEESKEDFSKLTKTIYKIEIEKKSESIVKNVDVKKETFNIYISGIDTYGKITSVSRSDVNIIATVNPKTHQVLLTTIPRDYYVQLDGTTGLKDKLTHAGIYGIEKSVKTIENLLDIEINYYVRVNFSSLERIIDALGSVDVYSEYSFTSYDGTVFKKGYNRVNGKQALEFARTRKTVSGGDRTRGKNQEALIQAILNKAISKEIIMKYTSLLSSLEGSFQTNMSTEQITDMIKKQIDEMKPWNVTSISLDGTNGSEYTYSYGGRKLYVMIPIQETIDNAKAKIEEVSNDAILESTYKENTGGVNTPTQEAPKKQEPVQTEVKPTEYQMSEIERYLSKYELSDADATFIAEKMDEIYELAKADKAETFTDMSSASKTKAVAIVAEISSKTSVKATLTSDGVLTIFESDGKTVFCKVIDKDITKQTGVSNYVLAFAGLASVFGVAYIVKKAFNA